MAIIIRELKDRLKQLESKHRMLPSVVLETELRRRPVSLSFSRLGYEEIARIFKGSFLKGEIVEDDFVIMNLPDIPFDSSTLSKVERVAYERFSIDEIRDAPRIPHYKPGQTGATIGLELIKKDMVVASLFESRVYINRYYEQAEELADALIKEVYKFEAKPSLLAIIFARLIKAIRKMVKR